jgi:hypothetical protein
MFEYDYTLEESGVEIEEKSNKQVCNLISSFATLVMTGIECVLLINMRA